MTKQACCFWGMILLLMVACRLGNQEATDLTASPPLAVPSPEATRVSLNPFVTETAAATTPTPLILRLWTTEEVSPRSEVRGGTVLVEQLNSFDTTHPGLLLDVQLKVISGPGGVISYLSTARTIAPSILPDVALLPSSYLAAATEAGYIFPLDNLLPADIVNDLYPAAANLSRVGDQLMGYPFAFTDPEHLANNSATITSTFPVSWTALLNLPQTHFVFPAGDPAHARLTLQLYLAFGGTLTNETGQPYLQTEPLRQALLLLAEARTHNVLLLDSTNITGNTQAWEMFQTGAAQIVPTTVRHFLDNRASVPNSQFALLPGPVGPLPILVEAWVWVITTREPERQQLAAELITWLASETTMGQWTLATAQLPTRRSALALWTVDEAYQGFLQTQLEIAQPWPAAANSTVISALSEATFAVVEGSKTPDLAAKEAVDRVVSGE